MLQATKRFWGKKPGFDSGDVLHIGVNIGFALVVYAMVFHWQLTLLAIILVSLSKWRVLAVQPRFWMPNIRANLVDLIVGLSTVGLLHYTSNGWLAALWAVLYGVWLLALKPRDHEIAVGGQALWAQLLGIATLFLAASVIPPFFVCLIAWLIAWSSARHFFSNYEEPHYRLLSLAWGFIVLQLVWMSLHWLQYYVVFGLRIAVVAVIIGLMSLGLGSLYHAFKNDKMTKAAIVENLVFIGVVLMVVLLTIRWTTQL